MFGYSDLVVDPRNLVLMRDAGCPVTVDITHALQQPAGRALEVGSQSLLLADAHIHLSMQVLYTVSHLPAQGTSYNVG